ncbi:MAG: hypothetical protein IJU50_01930 [Lachnospiraceae bacterium]|nr:hypothetical protein [Lachnospiraceae bacterium]
MKGFHIGYVAFLVVALFGTMSLEAGDGMYVMIPPESLEELPLEDGVSYQSLTEEERLAYREILWAVGYQEENVLLSTKDPEVLDLAYNAMKNDHAEIFYIDGYSYIRYGREEEPEGISFTPEYNRGFAEILQARAGIDRYVNKFMLERGSSPSGYEKVKQAYEYLITHTEYDLEAADSQNICSAFLKGRSVCTGYARALQYLLDDMGFQSVLVTGTVHGGVPHAWVMVFLDGAYYHIDPTWGDASYQLSEDSLLGRNAVPEVNYDYFLVRDKDIRRTHRMDHVVELPSCESIQDNYFVREGAYFEYLDISQLERLFNEAYYEGRDCLTLKCADEEVYRRMRAYLLEEQHVFDYLRGEKEAVSYADKGELCSLSFWL